MLSHVVCVIDTLDGLPCEMCHAYKGERNGILLQNYYYYFFSLGYGLKKCPPPPMVEQAEILFEDQDYEIGMNNNPFVQEYRRCD